MSASPRYCELQVTSHFSFLRGASSCEELFAQAAALGIEALAVVDRNSTQPSSEAIVQLESLKKKYDILKWIVGIGIGLTVGAFTVGAYYRSVVTYIDNRTLPPGMIAFFNSSSCPANWDRADELRGRYIVGADPNHLEDIGKTVGIALESHENRPAGKHTHQSVNTVPVAGGGRDRMMGGGGGGFSDPQVPTNGGVDTSGNPLKEGTNAPYLILSVCKSPT